MEKIEKIWGNEQWVVNKNYCGKILTLKKYHQCSFHKHKIKTETFLVIEGSVLMEIEDNVFVIEKGDAVDIEVGQNHRFTGLEDSIMIEFSTHHEDDDSYREVESHCLNDEEILFLENDIKYIERDNNIIKKNEL